MDPQLLKRIRVPFTEELVQGWHMKDLNERGRSHLESTYRNILKPLEAKGYIFDGLELVSPIEFYDAITKGGAGTGSGTKEFEIAKNTFIGVRLKNHFRDPETGKEEELKCPLFFIPYTNRHGDLYTRNSLYGMQFVLAERGPSVDGGKDKSIFIRVTGYKFKVTRELHTFNRVTKVGMNTITSSMNMTLPANRFYAAKKDRSLQNRKKVPLPLLAWYLFGKHGFSQCMKEFAECEYQLDTLDTLLDRCSAKDGWEIFSNTGGMHPKVLPRPRGVDSSPEEPAIAIRSLNNSGTISNLGLQYVGGLLFMFGVFTWELRVDLIDDPNYWRLMIGKCSINLPQTADDESYLRHMHEHFASVEEYCDEHTINKYNRDDIKVTNTYEFLNHLMLNYSNLIKLYDPADMLHKELSSMEFLMDTMIEVANNFKFKIRNKVNIGPRYINRELDAHFRLFKIDESIRGNNVCLEQTGTDNPFIDYGLGVLLQTRATVGKGPGRKKEEFDPNHPGSVIHESQPFVCSYQYASKPSPDGRGSLQPRVRLVDGRFTALHEKDRELYEETKHRLRHRVFR